MLRKGGLLGIAGAAALAGGRVQPVRAAAGAPRIAIVGMMVAASVGTFGSGHGYDDHP